MRAGTHIRPHISVSERYPRPAALSFSNEIGYQRPICPQDRRMRECRPTVDEQ
jgi:hypothetical protein